MEINYSTDKYIYIACHLDVNLYNIDVMKVWLGLRDSGCMRNTPLIKSHGTFETSGNPNKKYELLLFLFLFVYDYVIWN